MSTGHAGNFDLSAPRNKGRGNEQPQPDGVNPQQLGRINSPSRDSSLDLTTMATPDPATTSAAKDMSPTVATTLRQLIDGRVLLLFGVWLALAVIVRPLLLEPHHGASGPIADTIRARLDVFALARAAGIAQWLSFALTIGLVVILQVRATTAGWMQGNDRSVFIWAGVYAIVLPLAYCLFVWSPASVITLMAHDTFIFVDAVHRISNGQVPSVDFQTPIGAVALYGPAIGAWLAGGYAGSVELASALLALGLGLGCAWVCASRVSAPIAALMVATVFMIVTPMSLLAPWPGQSVTLVGDEPFLLTDQLTHAMFYNRWGWGALVVCLLFLAPRRDAKTPTGEVVLFAVLLTLLFYLKLTYFVVAGGAAFVTALMGPRFVHTAALGAGLTALFVLIVGLPSGLLFGYISEVARASAISGNQLDLLAPIVRGGLTPILISTVPLVLIAMTDRLTWRDGLVALVIFAGSLLIISQNAQKGTICSLTVMAVYGIARLSSAPRGAQLAGLGVLILLSAPFILERSMSLMDQTTAARREEAREPPTWADLPALAGFHIPEREGALTLIAGAESQDERAQVLGAVGIMGRRQELRQGEFMSLVQSGLDTLRPAFQPGESVVTVDMSNPFSALLGARPAQGDWLSLHHERTFEVDAAPSPEVIFGDADHVMIAKLSMLQTTADLAQSIYGQWLEQHYPQRVENPYWTLYTKRPPVADQNLDLRGLTSASSD